MHEPWEQAIFREHTQAGCPICAHTQLVEGQIWCNLWEEGGVPPTSKLANLTRSGIKDYECSHFEKEIAISLTLLKFPSVEHSKVRVLLSRNIHLNTPPRLSLCIFLKILKNSVGSWIQWPLFNLSVRQVYTVHMLSCDWNHYSLFAFVRAYSHFCTRTGYTQPSCISDAFQDILSYKVLHFGPWTPFTETKDAVPPNLRG